VGAIEIVLVFLLSCLRDRFAGGGLGCGYDLACSSDLVDGYGRWICFVRTLVGWFIL